MSSSMKLYRLASYAFLLAVFTAGGGQRCTPVPTGPPVEDCQTDSECSEFNRVCGPQGNCIPSGCSDDDGCADHETCYHGTCYPQDAAWCDTADDCSDYNPCTVDECTQDGKCIYNRQELTGAVCGYDSFYEDTRVCWLGQCVLPHGFCNPLADQSAIEEQCQVTGGDSDWGSICIPDGQQKGGRALGWCNQCLPQTDPETGLDIGCPAEAPTCLTEEVPFVNSEWTRTWYYCGQSSCESDTDCAEGRRCEDGACVEYEPRTSNIACGPNMYCQPCDLDSECQGFGYCTGPYNDDPSCTSYGICDTWEAQTVILPTGRCNHNIGTCIMEVSLVADTCNDGDATTWDHCVPGDGCANDPT